MKEFDFCTYCAGPHSWKEEDYQKLRNVDREQAVKATLCPHCISNFHTYRLRGYSTLRLSERVDDVLAGKALPRRKS